MKRGDEGSTVLPFCYDGGVSRIKVGSFLEWMFVTAVHHSFSISLGSVVLTRIPSRLYYISLWRRIAYEKYFISSKLGERRDGIIMNCPTNRLASTAVYPAPDMSACDILHALIAPQKTMPDQILSGIHAHDLVPRTQIGLEGVN